MAQVARGIGTFLLIPGIVLLVAGLLAALLGVVGMGQAMDDHHSGNLLYVGDDHASRDRAEASQALLAGGLAGALAGLVLTTIGGTIMAFAEDRPAIVVQTRTA